MRVPARRAKSFPLTSGCALSAAALAAAMLSGCGGQQQTTRSPSTAPTGGVRQPVVSLQPGDPLVAQGTRDLRRGDADSALAAFERAIEINPTLTVAFIEAGKLHFERGDFDVAERRAGRAAELDPRNFEAQFLHAQALEALKRFAEAVRAYLRALAVRPNDIEANTRLALTYLNLGEPREAQRYAIRAVRLDPQDGPARATLGSVYARLGQHEAAVAEFQQAAELMELTPALLIGLADSLSRVGRHQEAIATLDQSLRLEASAAVHERIGAARFRMRDYEGAADAFRAALAADGNHFPALNGLAVCLLNEYVWSEERDLGAKREAMDNLRRSLQIEPNQPRILELLRQYS